MIRFSFTPFDLSVQRVLGAFLLCATFISAPAFAAEKSSTAAEPTLPPPTPLFASPIAADAGATAGGATTGSAPSDAKPAEKTANESASTGGGAGAAPALAATPSTPSTSSTESTTTTTTKTIANTQGTQLAPPPPQASASSANVPSAFTPAAPPPLPDQSLQNAVRGEAEQIYYDRKRKRITDTFEKAYEGLVPLGPNEVRDVMGRYERTQKSSVPPASGQPRGQVRIKTLSLDPGGDPPTVNVASGYVTTITILDATGQPWPIMDLGIGGNFEVSKTGAGQGGTHVVRIMPLTRFGYGNLSVLLQDLSTPIIFKLAAGGTTVDYRFDARVPRLGPNAKLSLIERKQLEAGSPLIMAFLDDAPPPDAKRVRLTGTDPRTKAWMINQRMFVRTPLTMLSPSWDASVSSADGTTVYELTQTPALLMSDGGALVRAHVLQQKEED